MDVHFDGSNGESATWAATATAAKAEVFVESGPHSRRAFELLAVRAAVFNQPRVRTVNMSQEGVVGLVLADY